MNARLNLEIANLKNELMLTKQALDMAHQVEEAAVFDIGKLASENEALKQRVMTLVFENELLKAENAELKEQTKGR